MKVLRHGNTYKEITCIHCLASLAYTKSDINLYSIPHRDDDKVSLIKYIICPECGRYITIDNPFFTKEEAI